MAIRINNPNIPTDVNKTNQSKSLGLKLPLNRGDVEGYFESTFITLDAAKENIKSLLKTRKTERVFQPELGVGLEDILFEQMDNEIHTILSDRIHSAFKTWLPYVGIKQIIIEESNTQSNRLNIKIDFFINNLPNLFDSVEVSIGI